MINSNLCQSLSFDFWGDREEWRLTWPPSILCSVMRKKEPHRARIISLFLSEFPGFPTQHRDIVSNLATLRRLSGAREEWGGNPTKGADIKKVGNLTPELRSLTVMHVTRGVGL